MPRIASPDIVGGEDFYSDAHRLLYRAIMELIADNKPADVVTVGEVLGSLKKLDYIGGMAYLGALVENVPTAANIRRYAEIVRERAILRRLAAAGGEIADSAYNPLGRSVRGFSTTPDEVFGSQSTARVASRDFGKSGPC